MNLKTITFDADSYQLVPKTATKEMKMAGMFSGVWVSEEDESSDIYLAMLATAPQPPEVDSMATASVSPWLPIDDFLSSETFGVVWVKTKDDIRLCNHKVLGMFVGVLTGALFTKREVTHVILLERPQAPEVE